MEEEEDMVPTVEDIVVVDMEDMVVDTGEFHKNCCFVCVLLLIDSLFGRLCVSCAIAHGDVLWEDMGTTYIKK